MNWNFAPRENVDFLITKFCLKIENLVINSIFIVLNLFRFRWFFCTGRYRNRNGGTGSVPDRNQGTTTPADTAVIDRDHGPGPDPGQSQNAGPGPGQKSTGTGTGTT